MRFPFLSNLICLSPFLNSCIKTFVPNSVPFVFIFFFSTVVIVCQNSIPVLQRDKNRKTLAVKQTRTQLA